MRSQQKVIYRESQEDHLDHEDAGELEDVLLEGHDDILHLGNYVRFWGEYCYDRC